MLTPSVLAAVRPNICLPAVDDGLPKCRRFHNTTRRLVSATPSTSADLTEVEAKREDRKAHSYSCWLNSLIAIMNNNTSTPSKQCTLPGNKRRTR